VDDARRFIRSARTEWLDRPGHGRSAHLDEITHTVFALSWPVRMQRKGGGIWHLNRTEQETEEAAFERMLRNRAAAVPKDKLTAEMIENPRYGLKPRELTKEEADRLDALPIDYSDIPPLGDEFFSKALWTGKSPETQSDAGNAET
jgi:hypothetical protein